MKTPDSNLEVALHARDLGIVAIPCYPETKVPIYRWKMWQTVMPPLELQQTWFRDARVNIAIITTSMLVFDCDDATKADMVLEECGDTPHKLKTPHGIHLGFRRRMGLVIGNQVRIRKSKKCPEGIPIDIRTNGGIEVIANSRTEDGEYRWLEGAGLHAVSDLPFGNIGWTRSRVKRAMRQVLPDHPGESRSHIRNPEAYCLRIESTQGQNGSRGLVRVVCVLRDAGRSPQQIFDFVMGPWNDACARPPWSEGEVLHAIDRHCGK